MKKVLKVLQVSAELVVTKMDKNLLAVRNQIVVSEARRRIEALILKGGK